MWTGDGVWGYEVEKGNVPAGMFWLMGGFDARELIAEETSLNACYFNLALAVGKACCWSALGMWMSVQRNHPVRSYSATRPAQLNTWHSQPAAKTIYLSQGVRPYESQ